MTDHLDGTAFPTATQRLAQLGALCGRLHRLGESYPRRDTLDYAGSSRTGVERRAALLRFAEQNTNPEIANEARGRVRILESLGEALEHRTH